MPYKVTIKQFYPSPDTLKAKGIASKITNISYDRGQWEIIFETEPTPGEVQVLIRMFKEGLFEDEATVERRD